MAGTTGKKVGSQMATKATKSSKNSSSNTASKKEKTEKSPMDAYTEKYGAFDFYTNRG